MTMHLKPILRYQLRDYLTSGAVLFLINVLLVAGAIVGLISFGTSDTEISFSNYGFTCAIFLFVFGIMVPRQSMRIGVQLGVCRRTTFLGSLLSTAIAALGLAAIGELLLVFAQILTSSLKHCYFSDFYTMIYHNMAPPLSLTLGEHLTSVLFSACLMLCCWTAGCFFTSLFWRLNKIGCIIAGISIPVVLNGVPALLYYFRQPMAPLVNFLTFLITCAAASPWFAMGLFLIIGGIIALICWLLLRNANIRGTALK